MDKVKELLDIVKNRQIVSSSIKSAVEENVVLQKAYGDLAKLEKAEAVIETSLTPEHAEELLKAKKGTPQYEEWLQKYLQKRSASPKEVSEPKKKSVKAVLDKIQGSKLSDLDKDVAKDLYKDILSNTTKKKQRKDMIKRLHRLAEKA